MPAAAGTLGLRGDGRVILDRIAVILDRIAAWGGTSEGDIRVVATAATVAAVLAARPAFVVLSASDRAASDRAASDRAASDRAASDRAASDREASDRAASDRAASDREASDRGPPTGGLRPGASDREAVRAGARSYALQNESADQIRSAIREVAVGRTGSRPASATFSLPTTRLAVNIHAGNAA